ncbi:hypothetical protein FPHYL_11763 [Fusarium phyllophilum]|uniref:Azaphilone pigments biosynthesis cluster protein L N-terminal domain-containing protein n=1 Tax=Fusarium phyllophilum TaxID=47803 RepID=A0A8H5IRW8_9HYPO|nr:hypothetical protein FPHYL_11763 [Fusarium phyllophilum]
MAAEAAGLAASVITIADAAYKSSKRLNELIDGFRAASRTLSDLHTDLSSFEQLLQSPEDALGNTDDESLSDEMRKCLHNLKPCMVAYYEIAREHNRVVMEALQEHAVALQQCLRVCYSAADAAPASTSNTVHRMEGYDLAKQFVADDIGNAVVRSLPITVGVASARQQAQQALLQNVGADSIDGVMKFFQQSEEHSA